MLQYNYANLVLSVRESGSENLHLEIDVLLIDSIRRSIARSQLSVCIRFTPILFELDML
jgi:hypothetical protein